MLFVFIFKFFYFLSSSSSLYLVSNVYILIKGRTVSPSESFQQMARTRNIKRLYFHGNDKNKEVLYHTIEVTAERYKNTIDLSKKLNVMSSYFDKKDDLIIIENAFYNLFIIMNF